METVSINLGLPNMFSDDLSKKSQLAYRSLRAESNIRLIDTLSNLSITSSDIDIYICDKKDIGTYVLCELGTFENSKLESLKLDLNNNHHTNVTKSIVAGACLAFHLAHFNIIGGIGFRI